MVDILSIAAATTSTTSTPTASADRLPTPEVESDMPNSLQVLTRRNSGEYTEDEKIIIERFFSQSVGEPFFRLVGKPTLAGSLGNIDPAKAIMLSNFLQPDIEASRILKSFFERLAGKVPLSDFEKSVVDSFGFLCFCLYLEIYSGVFEVSIINHCRNYFRLMGGDINNIAQITFLPKILPIQSRSNTIVKQISSIPRIEMFLSQSHAHMVRIDMNYDRNSRKVANPKIFSMVEVMGYVGWDAENNRRE